MTEIRSPLQALIVQWQVKPGDTVCAGDLLVVLEAMKMEHELRATAAGRVAELFVAVGDAVNEGEILLSCEPLDSPKPKPTSIPISGFSQ